MDLHDSFEAAQAAEADAIAAAPPLEVRVARRGIAALLFGDDARPALDPSPSARVTRWRERMREAGHFASEEHELRAAIRGLRTREQLLAYEALPREVKRELARVRARIPLEKRLEAGRIIVAERAPRALPFPIKRATKRATA
jgi:hypothetical protein